MTEVHYTSDVAAVSPEDLGGFFEGWPDPPDPAAHLRILAGSDRVVMAREGADGPVVGFVTGITDGVIAAYLPLLEVLPSHRGRGIGTELVRRMLAELDDLYMVDVTCDPDVQPFYARLGFTASTGAVLRRYDRQSCPSD